MLDYWSLQSSNGAYDLKLVTNSGTDSSYINIVTLTVKTKGTGYTEIGGDNRNHST